MKFRILMALVVLAGITTGFHQRHEITELRSSIAARKETASAEKVKARMGEVELAKVDAQELERLRADKLALMKLRSEISDLRKMGGSSPSQAEASLNEIRGELAREQKREEDLAAQKKEYEFKKSVKGAFTQVNATMYQLMLGDSTLLPQSSDDLINRINALPEYNPYRKQLLDLINPTNAFGVPQFIEILPSKKVTNHNASLIARERQPRQLPDGQWARNYGSSDGRVNEVILPDQNFEQWEKEFR